MKKKLSLILVIVLIVASIPIYGQSSSFTGASSWAVSELNAAMKEGLIPDSMLDGKYQFNQMITRGDFARAAVLFYDKLGGNQTLNNYNPFEDVTDPTIIKAYNNGLISGKASNLFMPNDSLTRQEFCVITVKTLKSSGNEKYSEVLGFQSKYSDIEDISPWAYTYVESLNAHRIMNGTSDTTLSPKGNLTAEQAIVMLYRAYFKFYEDPNVQQAEFRIQAGVLKSFEGKGKIEIPETVTSIDPNVFKEYAGITEITIPGTVKEIPEDAFRRCPDLKRVVLNNGVEKIGKSSFAESPKLEFVYFPESIKTIEESAFADCSLLTEVRFGKSLATIGANAFREIGINQITIPNSVKIIGDEAFYKIQNLRQVEIVNDYTEIGRNAFGEANLGLTIICGEKSTGEKYATDNRIEVEYR